MSQINQAAQELFNKAITIYKAEIHRIIQNAPNKELLDYGVYLNDQEYEIYNKVKQISAASENIDEQPESEEITYPMHIQLDGDTIRERIDLNPDVIDKFSLSMDHSLRLQENLIKNSDYQRSISGLSILLKSEPQLITSEDFYKIAIDSAYNMNTGAGGLPEYSCFFSVLGGAIALNKQTYEKISEYVQLWTKELSAPNSNGEEWIETGNLIHIWPDINQAIDVARHGFENKEKLNEKIAAVKLESDRHKLEGNFTIS
jgi:hypothetical protein